jgi:ferredoxin
VVRHGDGGVLVSRIVVTVNECQGHGRCYDKCPEVFEPDVEGFVQVKPGVEVLAGSPLAELVRLAVVGCPEQALAMVTEPPSDA